MVCREWRKFETAMANRTEKVHLKLDGFHTNVVCIEGNEIDRLNCFVEWKRNSVLHVFVAPTAHLVVGSGRCGCCCCCYCLDIGQRSTECSVEWWVQAKESKMNELKPNSKKYFPRLTFMCCCSTVVVVVVVFLFSRMYPRPPSSLTTATPITHTFLHQFYFTFSQCIQFFHVVSSSYYNYYYYAFLCVTRESVFGSPIFHFTSFSSQKLSATLFSVSFLQFSYAFFFFSFIRI